MTCRRLSKGNRFPPAPAVPFFGMYSDKVRFFLGSLLLSAPGRVFVWITHSSDDYIFVRAAYVSSW